MRVEETVNDFLDKAIKLWLNPGIDSWFCPVIIATILPGFCPVISATILPGKFTLVLIRLSKFSFDILKIDFVKY